MLEVKIEIIDSVLVIHLVGRLDGLTSKLFVEKTGAPEHANQARIVLNCKELNYISSEGLRVMLMTAKRAKSLGGALTLCELNPSVNEVMVISGFGDLLGVHASVDKAIAAIS
jgi:anti-anti-sigma factor